jgi:ribonuclease VapC
VIVDSSALIAILNVESEADTFAALIQDDTLPKISATTVVEVAHAAGHSRRVDVDELIANCGAQVVDFTAEHARVARQAFHTYGRGSGSRARLNFGDCMAYALAKATGEPLLFKGDDFTHTDVTPAP